MATMRGSTDSSTTSWARRNRDQAGPSSQGATDTPIGQYLAFSRTAAATAAAKVPPVPRIDTAANCAEPAKVVADMMIGASQPMPAERASSPNETPKPATATASAATARAPSR